MKAYLPLLAAAVLALAPIAAVAAPTEISVSGTGTVTLPPDLATVDAAVETNARTASDAVAQNNAVYNRILASLERLGIARTDVALAYYNVSYTPKPEPAGVQPAIAPVQPQRWGYTVSRGFTVKVRDIGKAGSVSDACTAGGATAINGVSFGLGDTTAARSQATAKAVAEARANADALAAAAGLHVVSIKSIDMGGGGVVGPVPMMRAAAAAAPTQFDQSNVSVNVSVSVTFLAQP